MSKLGSLIREYRTRMKLTTTQLAEVIGVSQGTISQIENGRRNPSEEVLKNLIETLKIPVNEIPNDPDKNNTSNKSEIKVNVAGIEITVSYKSKIDPKRNMAEFEEKIICESIEKYLENSKGQLEYYIKEKLKDEALRLYD